MTLSPAQRQRYDRNLRALGEEAQARLLASRVLVVGAGGLGSPVLLYLAAAGVGAIGISDPDPLELTNLQRQVVHGTPDLGAAKAESARARLAALNPDVAVTVHPRVTPENAAGLLAGWDAVVDATDTFDAKYLIGDTCAATGTPHVWGTLVGLAFQVSVFWTRPPAPLPAVTLRDLHPAPPATGATPTSLDVGVLGAVCGQAGSVMAAEAIKVLTGIGAPLVGRVLVGDAAAARWDVLSFAGPVREEI
ncbi:MAG: HesA/MoeB/ThiF family protein [Actinomycetales bacterium]|nr:HesA/MoeB/ThiF family protein [Actinomycetales bacterium]